MTQASGRINRRQLVLGTLGVAVSAALPAAVAQGTSYPNRAITFVCPWPAGGTADVTMRVLAQVVSRE